MGFMFCDLQFLSNNPSSGDINSSNLPCLLLQLYMLLRCFKLNCLLFKHIEIIAAFL